MSEESKPKKISSNKDFAKMRVNGKKGMRPGGKPGAKPYFGERADGRPAFKSRPRPEGSGGSSSFKRPSGPSKGGFGKHGAAPGHSGSKRRDSARSASPRHEFRREGSTQTSPEGSTQAPHEGSTRPTSENRPEFRREESAHIDFKRPEGPKIKFVKRPTSGDSSDDRPSFKPRFSRDSRPARPNPKDVVSPSRLEAAKALFSIENGAKINDMLEVKRNLIPEDEALLRELVYGCTRQKRLLDFHLNKYCKTEYEKLPIEIKTSLRLGLYQLLFLTRVPAHAAVFESVNLVKQAGHEAMAGFVNAVLRTIETEKEKLTIVGKDDIDTLAIKYSHPTWITKRWAARWPGEKVEAILKADNQPHPVFLNVRPGAKEKVLGELAAQKVQMTEMEWPGNTLKLKSHEGGLFTGESFQQGDWIVQDWTPQAMMALLPLNEGQRAWDVCSAPGGKTVGLAWRVGEKGHVTASDASAERRKRLVENIKRTGLKQVQIFDHEIEKLSPAQKFDLAWVDAPCSGTGVMARRADLRWKIKIEDVLAHVEQQRDLLEQAQGHLYPKGSLVYSTCSLEKEENENIVASFLKDHPEFKVVKLPALKGLEEVVPGDLGTMFLPTEEHDGGFLAILTRE